MIRHREWNNRVLLVLLLAFMAYSILQTVQNIEWVIEKYPAYPLLFSLGYAAENICHWTVTQTYIKTAF